jgi:hypothetical protein
VEAAGQRFCLFRDRLDYAFTPGEPAGGRGVLSGCIVPDPSAGSAAVGAAGL